MLFNSNSLKKLAVIAIICQISCASPGPSMPKSLRDAVKILKKLDQETTKTKKSLGLLPQGSSAETSTIWLDIAKNIEKYDKTEAEKLLKHTKETQELGLSNKEADELIEKLMFRLILAELEQSIKNNEDLLRMTPQKYVEYIRDITGKTKVNPGEPEFFAEIEFLQKRTEFVKNAHMDLKKIQPKWDLTDAYVKKINAAQKLKTIVVYNAFVDHFKNHFWDYMHNGPKNKA